MLSLLKGLFSASLLSSKSDHTVSRASLFAALGLALFIALLSGIFAFAQWQMARDLIHMQSKKADEVSRRLDAAAHMATDQANAHRATLNVLLSRDTAELEEADAFRQSNLQEYSKLSTEIANAPDLHDPALHLQALTAQYEELSDQVVSLFRQGRKEDALDLRVRRLRESFNHWQDAHEDFLKQLGQLDQRQNADYQKTMAANERWFLGFLLAPLVLIVSGVLVMAALLGIQRIGPATTDTWTR